MNLILIGYRGTGKSTVARRLALKLGWDWADADVEVELAAGKSIAAIFEDDGETAFRHLEAHILAELTRRDRLVLAAGGPEGGLELGSASGTARLYVKDTRLVVEWNDGRRSLYTAIPLAPPGPYPVTSQVTTDTAPP